MRGLAAAFPKLKLFLREEQTALLLEKLENGQIDLALLALPYDTGDCETMALGEDRIIVALPRAHPLAAARRIAREDLAGEDLLLMEDGHCLRSHALQACRLAGPDRNEVFQGTSLRTLVQMAGGGIGITLMPEMAVASELPSDGSLVAKPLAPGQPSRIIALAWRRRSARKAEFRSFGKYLKTVLDDIKRGDQRRP
jgi:LysR family hydrogen peroxide-inducible transcriptional activator